MTDQPNPPAIEPARESGHVVNITGLSSHGEPLPWWKKAASLSIVGCLVSIVLSTLLVAAIEADIPPFPAIDRFGADLGNRIYTSFLPSIAHERAARPRFVFLDAGRSACERLPPGEPGDCLTGNPISAALIGSVIDAAAAGHAAILVLDVAPFEGERDRRLIEAHIRDAAGTAPAMRIIAPLRTRPDTAVDGSLVRNGDCTKDLAPGPSSSNLLLADFTNSYDPVAGDGIARSFPAFALVRDGGRSRAVPTAPYLIAELRRTNAAERQAVIGGGCGHELKPSVRANLSPVPIIFTFQSIVPTTGEGRGTHLTARLEGRYLLQYQRIDLGKVKAADDGRVALDPELIKGQTVILGSSWSVAEDWHATPVGSMTGAEVIINAATTFEAQSASTSRMIDNHQIAFAHKVSAAVTGALLMFPVWSVVILIARCREGMGRLRSAITLLGAVLVFVIGISVVVLRELYVLTGELGERMTSGEPTDVILPILVLGLEIYGEAITHALKVLDHVVERFINVIELSVSKLIGEIRRWRY
ncbi:MAG: CHASE2 domain-containing protein [Sandarakinorhabdus sp.]